MIAALMLCSAPAVAQQPPVMIDDLIVLSQSRVSDDTILFSYGPYYRTVPVVSARGAPLHPMSTCDRRARAIDPSGG